MEIIHSGFDGLEISIRTIPPESILNTLSAARARADESRGSVDVCLNGVDAIVLEGGAKGGYAYKIDTGYFGATWFVKHGQRTDPWSVRVSIKSLPLALNGPTEMVRQSKRFLETLGCVFSDGDMRVTRFDYAADFIDSAFVLMPDRFVCHSRQQKQSNQHIDVIEVSNRVTGLRIGKMPGSQLAVYDKSKDVADKHKAYWWDIWERTAGRQLDRRTKVWRIEARLGKTSISAQHTVRNWGSIAGDASGMLQRLTQRIRMVEPGQDTNRARWPNARLWDAYRTALTAVAVEPLADVDRKAILRALEVERRNQLRAQLLGVATTLAGSEGIGSAIDLSTFIDLQARAFRDAIAQYPEQYEEAVRSKHMKWQALFSNSG